MIILKKILIDYIIKNNDEITKKENLKADYKINEYLKIKDDYEVINISFNNGNIIMERDSSASNIIFNFINGKETETKYFIKELNFYIDTKIKTKNIQISDNKIFIEYELWLSSEYSGNFIYEINLKL